MKGLLHRLAARAAGSAIAVRSDARLPFAYSRAQGTAGSGLDQSLAIGDAASTISAPDTSTATLEVAPTPAPTIVTPPPPVSARQAVSIEVAGEVRALRAASSSSTLEARVPPRLVESVPADDVHSGTHHAEPSIGPLHRAPAHEPASRHSERVAVPAREPALLMPETVAKSPPRPTPLAPASTRVTAGSVHAAPPDEPNEVHIHIGRIEVTAVQESVAPRRRAAASAAAPMSLQEYFSKRGRT